VQPVARLLTLATLLGCGAPQDVLGGLEPTQSSDQGAIGEKGTVSFEQRQRDCWDMPNAEACYEVGMEYELGVHVKRNRKTAREYYRKACDLDHNAEHCQAAERMRP
jgi:TPR repeat protein